MKVAGCAKRGDAKPSRGRGQSLTGRLRAGRSELAAEGGDRLREALDVLGGVVD
jgi:hypothetical protein